MWHNGLSINISLLTEIFTVFFQNTKVLRIIFDLFLIEITLYLGDLVAKIETIILRNCII